MDLRAELAATKNKYLNLRKGAATLAKEATLEAVKEATEATPPTIDDLAGTHARTGRLKGGWAKDSETEPSKTGGRYETALKNAAPYASYVNDGHRMDRHFVPGLYVNPYSGELEYDSAHKNDVGIMVGTKTAYVSGVFMTEKGEKAYSDYIDEHGAKILEVVK